MSDMSTTDVDLPARAARRGLSVEAYLKQLEASRRWKREHPAEARSHCYARCDCGKVMARQSPRCTECRRADDAERVRERRRAIELYWAMGMTLLEIAAVMDSTKSTVSVEITRMRELGWDVPYRHRGWGHS